MTNDQNCLDPSVRPSILLPIWGKYYRCCSLTKDMTSLSPATSSSLSKETPRHYQASQRCHLYSVSWVFPSGTCLIKLIQESLLWNAWTTSASSFWCRGVVTLLWAPLRCWAPHLIFKGDASYSLEKAHLFVVVISFFQSLPLGET